MLQMKLYLLGYPTLTY